MWFRYDDTNPLNFAWRWRQWEEAHPCPHDERHRWPAFSPSGDEVPFTGGRADACLNALLAVVMTAAEAAKRSWHSARITLATRLFARRGDTNAIARDDVEGVIQSLVRWKTVEAMRIYARMEPEMYATYVDMAANLQDESDGTMPDGLCEVDPRGVLLETENTLAAIEAEAAATKTAASKAAAKGKTFGEPSKAGKKAPRRPTPQTGDVAEGVSEPEPKRVAFDIGDGIAVQHVGEDSWGLVGKEISLHNSFWTPACTGRGEEDFSTCVVVGYIGKHKFAERKTAAQAYVVECEGNCYPATDKTVARALKDQALKRRLQKAKPLHRL